MNELINQLFKNIVANATADDIDTIKSGVVSFKNGVSLSIGFKNENKPITLESLKHPFGSGFVIWNTGVPATGEDCAWIITINNKTYCVDQLSRIENAQAEDKLEKLMQDWELIQIQSKVDYFGRENDLP